MDTRYTNALFALCPAPIIHVIRCTPLCNCPLVALTFITVGLQARSLPAKISMSSSHSSIKLIPMYRMSHDRRLFVLAEAWDGCGERLIDYALGVLHTELV